MSFSIVEPGPEHLESYRAALLKGWSPDNVTPEATAARELKAIEADPAAFLASMTDPQAKGAPITLPDGRQVPRLPGFRRWMWDGEVCGSIGLRWQDGTNALPAHVLGHIGYSVVPWKRGLGYATQALAQILPQAQAVGLTEVLLTTDPDNLPSQKVMLANGAEMVRRFTKDAAYGGSCGLLFRIAL